MTKSIKGSKSSTSRGFLLWGLVLTGYFIFVFNWVIMNKLAGSAGHNGWMAEFFSKNPSSTMTQAVNYTITAMRGVGAIGAGFVIAKVGHKYAVIIALALLSLALPAVFFSHIHSNAGYWLFIGGRMFMAIGGTVLIVYTQPIISRFFNAKQKGMTSSLNSLGFNLGAALPLILFMIPSVRTSMLNDWEIWAAVVAGTPIILLIVYFFVGEQIDITSAAPAVKGAEVEKQLPATWGSVAKEKTTWKLGAIFGGWLVLVVAVILIMPTHFAGLHAINFSKLDVWEVLLPIVLFIAGLIPGLFLVGWATKHNVDRRIYISLVSTLAIVFVVAAYLMNVYVSGIWGPAIFMLLAGTCAWGIQGTILLTPHEIKGNSPQRVAIMMGFVWGVGYFIYTITNIIMAVVFDAFPKSDLATASWVQFGIYIAVSSLLPIVILIVPKTREKAFSTIFRKNK